MAANQQTVKAWWQGVRAGVSLGVRILSAFPTLTDPSTWEKYKRVGIGAVRWTCQTAFNQNGEPQGTDFDVLAVGIGAGVKVWLDCCGSWDVDRDGVAIAQRLTWIAQEVARRGWTPEQIKLGIWFEPLAYSNATVADHGAELLAALRSVLPEHVITISGGEFASLATLTDGTFVPPQDPGCDVRVNVAPDAQLGQNEGTWATVAARLDKFTEQTGLFVSIGNLEFGNPGVDEELTDWNHFPATIRAAILGLSSHIPFFDGIKDNDFGMMNVGQANPSLRGDIAEAFLGAFGLSIGSLEMVSRHTVAQRPIVTVDQPEVLYAGLQQISGRCDQSRWMPGDPVPDVKLSWESVGDTAQESIPVVFDPLAGTFTAQIPITGASRPGTLYITENGGIPVAAWTSTPEPVVAATVSDNTSTTTQGNVTMPSISDNPRPSHLAPREEWHAWAEKEAASAKAAADALKLQVQAIATGGPLPDGVAKLQIMVTAFDIHGNSVGLPVVAHIG